MTVVKHANTPDDKVDLPDGSNVAHMKFEPGTVSLMYCNPGWKWSEHVKPRVGTECCEKEHMGYVVTGRMAVQMTGEEVKEFGAGDAFHITPGHDGWVVGEEKVTMVEFTPKEHTPYAMKKE